MVQHQLEEQQQQQRRPWIRGVNLGGWLVLERFITPYLFAITSCHLEGDFCWYKEQIDAPPKNSPFYKLCNLKECKPILAERKTNQIEYPIDEYTLMESFADKGIAHRFMQFHWDNFVTHEDIEKLAEAGVTHIRVPLPHWIMGDVHEGEPWVDGGWIYFIRLVSWCRKYGIKIWPDLHTAPGSQNGFDNSGQFLGGKTPTCVHWCNSEENVNRTIKAVQDITQAIVQDGLEDVVTGFGILNEPFKDCDREVVEKYNTQALHIVRSTLGNDTAVYMGDLFNATVWNNGWWNDEENTYVDSHYYHVFDQHPRHLSPRQHIAFVCQKQHRDTTSCCYEDHPKNTVPSKGVSRIIGEWSASFDTLVDAQLDRVMKGIAANGTAPFFDRQIEPKRQAFLRNYVEAQMVTYEAVDEGVSSGWFYWTLKTEGGAFAEWDFLRGLQDGWIPSIPKPNVSSVDLYGTCYDIIFKTDDNYTIVHEYPDATSLDPNNWQGVDIDDDVVVSHGETLHGDSWDEDEEETKTTSGGAVTTAPKSSGSDEKVVAQDSADDGGFSPSEIKATTAPTLAPAHHGQHHRHVWPLFVLLFFMFAIKHVFFKDRKRRNEYTELSQDGAARQFNV